jgi:hypothetical protein
MESPSTIEEERRMANSKTREEGTHRDAPSRDTRGEDEKPRAEMPEWLAKELFKIFV